MVHGILCQCVLPSIEAAIQKSAPTLSLPFHTGGTPSGPQCIKDDKKHYYNKSYHVYVKNGSNKSLIVKIVLFDGEVDEHTTVN